MSEERTIRAMSDLDKEIEELEKAITGTPKEEPTEHLPVKEVEPTEVIATPTPDLQKDYDQLQKRFNNYKGSTDKTLHTQRQELAKRDKIIATLSARVETLEQSLSSGVEDKSITSFLSDEDKEILGETAVNALDKSIKEMVKAQVEPLKDQLTSERNMRLQEQKRRAEDAQLEKYQLFLSQLSQAVPDYQAVISDDNFRLKFMKEPDIYSGIVREELFKAAEEDGDVGRVASFFNEYKTLVGTKDKKLDKYITPTGVQGPTVEELGSKPKWDINPAFIDKFYNDLAKGDNKYKGKQGRALADEIETAIDNWVMSGGHKRI